MPPAATKTKLANFSIKGYGQGHKVTNSGFQICRSKAKVKIIGISGKVLSHGIHMWSIKALPVMVRKIRQRLNIKFLEMYVKGHSQGHKVNDLDAICKGFIRYVCVPNRKSISYGSKVIAKVKVFLPQTDTQTHWQTDTQTHWQTDTQTVIHKDRTKTRCPEFHSRGIITLWPWHYLYQTDE